MLEEPKGISMIILAGLAAAFLFTPKATQNTQIIMANSSIFVCLSLFFLPFINFSLAGSQRGYSIIPHDSMDKPHACS